MKTLLITAGPVYGKLDSVKLITNKFKGGRIANLARKLSANFNIIYLVAKGSTIPQSISEHNIKVVYQDGIDDYLEKVLEYAPQCEGVILGAAVANLVPVETIQGKFPSHNYKEGDVIPINFKIATRIVDKVKNVAPNTKLFAFKLLSNVSNETLINAAYEIVLESKAVAVFANDTNNLDLKYAVTKEKSIIPLKEYMDKDSDELSEFITKCVEDSYFKTKIIDIEENYEKEKEIILKNYLQNKQRFTIEGKYMFGTIAVRTKDNEFVTTTRGKDEFADFAYIKDVNENTLEIISNKKASLNSPLLFNIFKNNPSVYMILHTHTQIEQFNTLDYAIPGTLRDSNREVFVKLERKEGESETRMLTGFNIKHHGSFIFFSKKDIY